ncbi:MAG: transporter substrate-binding domain-containing protein [Desulfobacterales bacterium]|nr:transporter substrate-binding domain-containing protein [Desulfobacterales bacterium]MCP4161548.1 transporter substrate-binding domain-containing protein [Deltaproteobacteria bacterium]
MRKIFLVFLIVLSTFIYSGQVIAETILVGGYQFPPFIEIDENKQKISGITIDLIKEMNEFQKKFKFKFTPTSSKRRYLFFEEKRFDIIMFEDIKWGWKNKDIVASKVILKGGDVYITKYHHSKNQSYFENLKKKSLAVILGYHYGFANYNADEKFLKKNFKIQFNTNHKGNIIKVLFERVDIAVVTLSFLKMFLKNNPDIKSKILVSKKFDQHYNHTILLRKNFKITKKEMNEILTKMEKAGVLSRLWKRYGIE